MNQTTADSQKDYDVICMSFGKPLEKGIEVVEAGEKDSFLKETMEIKTVNCDVRDMGFSKEQMETLLQNRKARRTEKSLKRTESQR